MTTGTMDPNLIAVRPASRDKQLFAEQKFSDDSLSESDSEKKQVITFEFGIPENHLIFSKPVYLSVDAGDIPDGSWVDLLVLHAGDVDYNTSGLMIDPDGECFPDGTASKPASRAQVAGSQVAFYTCGASTFALGYVPARDFPNNTVYTLSPTSDNKAIIGGAFTSIGGVTMGRVARV